MGKLQPRSFERIRSGEQIQYPTYTNVAAAVAAGITAAKNPRRLIYLSAGGTGSVPCLAISDGTNWRQIALGANAI
jgi:N-acetylmuramic acid 6-phosphate (MurNAc-6-P) etherase